ncbi:hypothetical protein [Pseudomonas boanensis]|uniref:hypothetical protein n=1 Tax=Metapseudomonas boanensis TaxID=2822138 RepID=UPI0035D4BF30
MRLSKDFYWVGEGGKSGPTFFGTTKKTLEQKMMANGRVKIHSDQPYFRCIYCDLDNSLSGLGESRRFHPAHLVQFDHITPWASIVSNFGAYYGSEDKEYLIQLGHIANPAFGSPDAWSLSNLKVRDLLYNDLDNLHIVCTGHNQNKANQEVYLGKSASDIKKIYSESY